MDLLSDVVATTDRRADRVSDGYARADRVADHPVPDALPNNCRTHATYARADHGSTNASDTEADGSADGAASQRAHRVAEYVATLSTADDVAADTSTDGSWRDTCAIAGADHKLPDIRTVARANSSSDGTVKQPADWIRRLARIALKALQC